jgi:hypothetical protein
MQEQQEDPNEIETEEGSIIVRAETPLDGSPQVSGATGPDVRIVNIAEAYAAEKRNRFQETSRICNPLTQSSQQALLTLMITWNMHQKIQMFYAHMMIL